MLRGMEEREYQKRIVETATKKNTLVCLPTGMGKTNIAILTAVKRLEEYPDSQILVLAPTKPLVNQHRESFMTFLHLNPKEFQVITGTVSARARMPLYKKKFLFATPQTVQRDLENERFSMKDICLLVIDELHHAVGKYAYPYIAKRFLNEADDPRILGLTASPGSNRKKIEQICKNTGIEAIEIRTEEDQDVKPYVKSKEISWAEVTLPERFVQVKILLDHAYQKRTRRLGAIHSKKQLLNLQIKMQQAIRQGNKAAFGLASIVAQALKIEHALALLETQGIAMLREYLTQLDKDTTRAAKSLLNDADVSKAIYLVDQLYEAGAKHPKMSKLVSLVQQEVKKNPEAKIIIFANFRDTAREIETVLSRIGDIHPLLLLGQKDLSQKQQLEIIRKYEDEANCLITTSIGEEGLSLESADLAIFYEPVPSEIRQIQRRGRVGRTKVGSIIVLVTLDTRDEAYRWAAYHKEKKMRQTLEDMKYSFMKRS